MKEIWKDIEGYEGLYQVSNLGRVKSLDRIIVTKMNISRLMKGKILTIVPDPNNYMKVLLSKEGKQQIYLLHRLVAQAFIPNPDNKPEIDHINTDRTDNTVWLNEDGSVNYDKTNLKWATRKENCNNPLTKEKIAAFDRTRVFSTETRQKISLALKGKIKSPETIEKVRQKIMKPILQLSLNGDIIKRWDSATEAKNMLGIKTISDCLRNRSKTAGGYIWKYEGAA